MLVAVLGLLVVGGLVDRQGSPARATAGPPVQPMPAAAPAAAISSTWFCAGATGQPTQVADGELVVANSLTRLLHGTTTLIPSNGPAVTTPFTVGALDRAVLPETAASQAPFVGAVVELDGGGAAVEQVVTGAQGMSTAACATSGSDRWYFADGTTQENANLYLALLNPYTEDAIVDLSFTTELGAEAPADFQGIVVPAQSLVSVDLGTHLRQRRQVAATVSARAGRVVAFKTQVIAPAPSPGGQSPAGPNAASGTPSGSRPPGLSLVLGSPSPGTTWWWPQGAVTEGVTERYQIFNPGGTAASVSLAVSLDQGSAEPFSLQVPPHGTVTVTSSNEARIPKGVGYAAVLRSENGVGVIAERTVDAAAPSAQTGLADVAGSRLTATRWLLAAGAADASVDEFVLVSNPGSRPAVVSLSALAGATAPLPGLSSLTVPAGGRVAVLVNDHSAGLNRALIVQSSGAVVVERDLDQAKRPGIDASIGVPIP
jgi:hypothetical protein